MDYPIENDEENELCDKSVACYADGTPKHRAAAVQVVAREKGTSGSMPSRPAVCLPYKIKKTFGNEKG